MDNFFKYLKKHIHPQDVTDKSRLCSIDIEFSHKSAGYRHKWRNSGSASEQFFIRPYSERKLDIKKHHDFLIENIFKKWVEIDISLSNEKHSFHTTVIPLYFDVMDKIDSIDGYKEGLAHLRDKRYSEALTIYHKMKELEKNHNQKVSDYMSQTETMMKDKIWNDQNIHLKDVNFLRKVYSDTDFLKKAIENGEFGQMDYEATKWGALNETVGVYFDGLFAHLLQQSINHKKNILEVETTQQKANPWFFPTLIRSDSRERIIAKGVPGSKAPSNLKSIIETEFEISEILAPLKEFQSEIDQMNELFSNFSQNIKQIIHDYHALRLRGKCRIENQVGILSRLFSK